MWNLWFETAVGWGEFFDEQDFIGVRICCLGVILLI